MKRLRSLVPALDAITLTPGSALPSRVHLQIWEQSQLLPLKLQGKTFHGSGYTAGIDTSSVDSGAGTAGVDTIGTGTSTGTGTEVAGGDSSLLSPVVKKALPDQLFLNCNGAMLLTPNSSFTNSRSGFDIDTSSTLKQMSGSRGESLTTDLETNHHAATSMKSMGSGNVVVDDNVHRALVDTSTTKTNVPPANSTALVQDQAIEEEQGADKSSGAAVSDAAMVLAGDYFTQSTFHGCLRSAMQASQLLSTHYKLQKG